MSVATNERLRELATGLEGNRTCVVLSQATMVDIAATCRAVIAARELVTRLDHVEHKLTGGQVLTKLRAILGASDGGGR